MSFSRGERPMTDAEAYADGSQVDAAREARKKHYDFERSQTIAKTRKSEAVAHSRELHRLTAAHMDAILASNEATEKFYRTPSAHPSSPGLRKEVEAAGRREEEIKQQYHNYLLKKTQAVVRASHDPVTHTEPGRKGTTKSLRSGKKGGVYYLSSNGSRVYVGTKKG